MNDSNNTDDNAQRAQMRQYFLDVWHKANNDIKLEALEEIVASIIFQHPEYHAELSAGEDGLDKDFAVESGESNPYLHMGLHISLQEQLGTNRPQGIQSLYQEICAKYPDPHDGEHEIMECLGEALWQAQRDNTAPDEAAYMNCVRARLAAKKG